MYFNHGAYYVVDQNKKWVKLHKSLSIALEKYAQIYQSPPSKITPQFDSKHPLSPPVLRKIYSKEYGHPA
jgi:hypothetical protein